MNQPIIQPGQIECEHFQNPSGNDPVMPDKIVRGMRAITFGGLSCREEIASRILAGMISHPELPPYNEVHKRVEKALEYTDALLAKTRPKAEGL